MDNKTISTSLHLLSTYKDMEFALPLGVKVSPNLKIDLIESTKDFTTYQIHYSTRGSEYAFEVEENEELDKEAVIKVILSLVDQIENKGEEDDYSDVTSPQILIGFTFHQDTIEKLVETVPPDDLPYLKVISYSFNPLESVYILKLYNSKSDTYLEIPVTDSEVCDILIPFNQDHE
jgi:hypothetical protein